MDEFYTRDELAAYIKSKLGNAVWRIEGFENTDAVEHCIDEALMMLNRRCPKMTWEVLTPFVKSHTLKATRIIGVLWVDFIEPVNRFAMSHTLVGLTQNLTGVAPVNIAGTLPNIAGDIIAFLQWRKTFQRVTSTTPQWHYERDDNTIKLYNPGAYSACALLATSPTFTGVKVNHKDWLRRMALAEAKRQLGIYRRKFASSIQGPGGTTLNLDGDKLVEEGEKEVEKFTEELMKFQARAWPKFD